MWPSYRRNLAPYRPDQTDGIPPIPPARVGEATGSKTSDPPQGAWLPTKDPTRIDPAGRIAPAGTNRRTRSGKIPISGSTPRVWYPTVLRSLTIKRPSTRRDIRAESTDETESSAVFQRAETWSPEPRMGDDRTSKGICGMGILAGRSARMGSHPYLQRPG